MSEIQKAIEFFKAQNENMERETWKAAEVCPAYKKNQVAISALQDQAEREKGCEWCKGLFHGGSADGDTLNELETRAIIAQGNYCPMCGRDLRKPVEK